MRELPLQNYIVRLRHWTRPSGINQGRPVIQGTHQLEDPRNLAIDSETIVDIGIWPCHTYWFLSSRLVAEWLVQIALIVSALGFFDINTVNRAKSYRDGDISDLNPLVHFAQWAHMHRFLSVVRVSVWIRPKIGLDTQNTLSVPNWMCKMCKYWPKPNRKVSILNFRLKSQELKSEIAFERNIGQWTPKNWLWHT